MKTFVFKLVALVVLAGAILALMVELHVPQVDKAAELIGEDAMKQVDRQIGLETTAVGITIGVAVLALWALLPQFKDKNTRFVRVDGAEGPVTVFIDPVEKELNRVVAKMPEVKRAKVRVSHDREHKKALVEADVVLQHQERHGVRDTANLVAQYIKDTAVNTCGLHEFVHIKINVTGITVDPAAVAQRLKDEAAVRVAKGLPPAPEPDAQVEIVSKVDLDAAPAVSPQLEPMASAPLTARASDYDTHIAPAADGEDETAHPATDALVTSSELLERLETSPAAAHDEDAALDTVPDAEPAGEPAGDGDEPKTA